MTATKALTARDLMQSEVLTVDPETPILDIHRLFVEEEIHGAPVVDEDQRVRGIITTLDLLRVVRDEYDGARTNVEELTAADAMTKSPLISVTPATSAIEIARILREQRIHRVLVIEDGVLLGVVTTFDLLRAFEADPKLEGIARQRGEIEC